MNAIRIQAKFISLWMLKLRSSRRFCLFPTFVASASWEIKRTSGIKWDPDDAKLSVGDDITFKLSGDTLGVPHGLRFSDWDSAKQYLRLKMCLGQQPFMQRQGQNDASSVRQTKCFFKAKD